MTLPSGQATEGSAPAPRALDFLRPRATKRAVKARGRRRIVGGLRFALPVAALLVLIVLVAWPVINPRIVATAAIKNIPDLVVQNLHFTGLDSKNQPYSLVAATATRPQGTANVYDLTKPEAEITLSSGAWVSGKARYGRYDQDTRQLWLGGDVQLFHDKGYQFTSNEAWVNLDGKYAWGQQPVLLQGDIGEVRGAGFKLLEGGSVMIVAGPAHAVLQLRPAPVSDKPGASQ